MSSLMLKPENILLEMNNEHIKLNLVQFLSNKEM